MMGSGSATSLSFYFFRLVISWAVGSSVKAGED